MAPQNKWGEKGCGGYFSVSLLGRAYLFGQATSLLWGAKNLVVEDREVEGEAQVDGVCWRHLTLTQIERLLVGLLGVSYSSWERKEEKSVNDHRHKDEHQNDPKAIPGTLGVRHHQIDHKSKSVHRAHTYSHLGAI